MSDSSDATLSRADVQLEGKERFERLVARRLFDDSPECKLWIIRMLVEIENDEEVSVHHLLSAEMMQEVKRSAHAPQPELQRAAVHLLTTILDVEANNMQYLLQHGILKKCIELLSIPDKNIFANIVLGLQSFLEWPESAGRLVELQLVEQLDRVLKESLSDSLHSDTFIFLSKFFHALNTPVSLEQAQTYLDVFFDFAANHFQSLTPELNKCVLQLCKYLFRVDMDQVFAEKANIVHIFEFFKSFPNLLRTVIGKLAHNPKVMKTIVKAESAYFFVLINEELPTATSTLTLTLLELLNVVLRYHPESITRVWHHQDIMEELESNLNIEKDLTIILFEIYSRLIMHSNYCRIAHHIRGYNIPEIIIKAIEDERNAEVIDKGLKTIDRILDFQARHLRGQANKRAFTQGLRNNTEAGAILEQLTQKPHKKSIMNYAQKILGQSFVKIQEQILPIDAVCKKTMEDEP